MMNINNTKKKINLENGVTSFFISLLSEYFFFNNDIRFQFVLTIISFAIFV